MTHQNTQVFISFDDYESKCLRRLQRDLEKRKVYMTLPSIVRGALRYFVHQVMGETYICGPDLEGALKRDPGIDVETSEDDHAKPLSVTVKELLPEDD